MTTHAPAAGSAGARWPACRLGVTPLQKGPRSDGAHHATAVRIRSYPSASNTQLTAVFHVYLDCLLVCSSSMRTSALGRPPLAGPFSASGGRPRSRRKRNASTDVYTVHLANVDTVDPHRGRHPAACPTHGTGSALMRRPRFGDTTG
jgi:hypothetical protein